ncbi:hypothetical protein FOFC_21671 [Fusarium oxysporum]|nr:hypothetical protein FOFC_21671 [Fusarium oxysporum]
MSSSPWASKEAAAFPDGTTDYEPLRSNTKDDPGRVHIADTPMTWSDIHLHINWLNTILIVSLFPSLDLSLPTGFLSTSIPASGPSFSISTPVLESLLMIFKRNPKHQGRTDITDLNEDPIVVWQHRNYFKCVILMALVMPTTVAGFGWGDWLGGFVYAGVLRTFFLQQATFCVNSLAHWLGEQPFDDRNSPRDHVVTAFVTLGEGYYNFHHKYPSDYRNAIKWYQYDPTKWSIWIWKQFSLAYDLKQFRQNEIEKGRVQQLQKKLDQKRATLDWGIPLEQFPVIHWDDFIADSKNGKALVAIAGVIHNVTDFIKDHPGGKALISSAIGKDATAIFNGGVYNHSNAAHNLLSTMRVGILRGGCEVEIWKRARFENEDVTYMNNSAGQHLVRAGA